MISKAARIYFYFFIFAFCIIGTFIGFFVFDCVKKSNYEKFFKTSKTIDCRVDDGSVGMCLKKELCLPLSGIYQQQSLWQSWSNMLLK